MGGELCKGHKKSGEPCRNHPRRGAVVCDAHGGKAPRVRVAAARRVAEVKAQAILANYGNKADVNPVTALLDEVQWTAGHVVWLRAKVQELSPDDMIWAKIGEVEKLATEFPGTDITHAATCHVWLTLYDKERANLRAVCKDAIQAGLAERQVKLAEQQGEMLGGVIKAILEDLHLTPGQRAGANQIVTRHLRAISA